jgi:hypothetical protein
MLCKVSITIDIDLGFTVLGVYCRFTPLSPIKLGFIGLLFLLSGTENILVQRFESLTLTRSQQVFTHYF